MKKRIKKLIQQEWIYKNTDINHRIKIIKYG